jgi:hypothetical protein
LRNSKGDRTNWVDLGIIGVGVFQAFAILQAAIVVILAD